MHDTPAVRPGRQRAPWAFVLAAVALIGLGCTTAAAEDEFLPPEQAFRVSASADGPDAVTVVWEVEPGYYMYRDKFRFAAETPGITAGAPVLPAGEVKQDEFFGAVPIIRGRVAARVPLTREAGANRELTLKLTSQGCADAGLCYPPQHERVTVTLPAMVARAVAAPVAVAQPPTSAPRALGLTNQSPSLGLAEDDILPVEEAFRFDALVDGPDRLRLRWEVADGTYMYRDEIKLTLEGGDGVQLGPVELPDAQIKPDTVRADGTVGDVAIYHGIVEAEVPLLRTAQAPTEVTLVARYQGCNERGICYPPVTRRIALALPAATSVVAPGAAPPASAAVGRVSEQDQIAERLASTGLLGGTLIFFGLGLLLAFTPCVFPMIPILSGIIAGQGKGLTTRKAFWVSLAYVLAMALTYAVIGVIAGLFGANLQATFQSPWVLGLFAAVFVGLALSMFGFYELQIPSSIQTRLTQISNRQQGGTLAGAAIMGALSAVIVGPCLAPPLMGALIFIGKTGDALLGFFALLGLGLGMGAPLLVIGTSAGKLLPRAGAWMDTVKAVFGVLLLAVAIVLLERVLAPAIAMLLWGVLLIAAGVYMGALTSLGLEAGGWPRLWKSVGLALLVWGVLMLVGAAAGGKDTLQPLRGLLPAGGGAQAAHASFKRIKSVADLDRELAAAGAAGRPVLLDFYADWCVSCKEMERDTFPDPAVVAAMQRFVLLQADVTANDADDKALMQDRFGLPGPPAMLFFAPTGEEQRGDRLVGFVPAERFAAHLREVAP